MSTISQDTTARWRRIAAHALGGDDARFAARVAKATGWPHDDAFAAIEEYRRFAFLACLGEEVTPSEAIDAVWHEHLLHTRDYWETFCPKVLGLPLHHSPGTGVADDAARFAAQYARTIALYGEHFGDAPRRWWPVRSVVRTPEHRMLGATVARTHWSRFAAAIAFASLPALAFAAVRPANPLDWMGGDFLKLYVALMLLVIAGTLAWRRWLRRQQDAERAAVELSTLEAAYLAGGQDRTVDAAVAELHQRGALAWNAHSRHFESRHPPQPLDAMLDSLRNALLSSQSVNQALKSARVRALAVRDALERRGLWQRAEQARRIANLTTLPAAMLLAFGIAKIAIGVQRDRPVTLLVFLVLVVAAFALAMWLAGARATPSGQRSLKAMRVKRDRRTRNVGDDLGLAVALGGTALLSGTAFAGYHELRQPPSSSSSDSSSSSSDSGSSSSDGGGGSSCGGCGGGGGGD